MIRKRLRSPYYTENKYVRTGKHTWSWDEVYGKDGTLFAKGIYPTLIRKEDLPTYYIAGMINHKRAWIDARNIYDMVYRPNKCSNHAFKDDFLMISYRKGQKIKKEKDAWSILEYTGYDVILLGAMIPKFVTAAKKYSSYDVSEIIEQIHDKLAWFKETYPEDYTWIIGNWVFDP